MVPGALVSRAPFRTPHGREEANEFFGWNPDRYLDAEGEPYRAWEGDNIRSARLPEPLLYLGKRVTSIRVHRLLVPVFEGLYAEIWKAKLWDPIKVYGGAYNFRLIRGGDELSMHAFGAAVDHDPAANPLGAPGEKCRLGNTVEGRAVVAIFRAWGFFWGGEFRGRKDCQHFQFGVGL